MKVTVEHLGQVLRADLTRPIDLSIPLRDGLQNPNCFWAPPVSFEPLVAGDFVGSTAQGSPVNFFNVRLNPHGNGTHTECVGHIAKERYTIRECLRQCHFFARVISIYPQKMEDGDRVILRSQLEGFWEKDEVEALIIRTLPNIEAKLSAQYSGTNPPYLHHEAIAYLVEMGIEHLLLDLPSVDREEDGGLLLGHKAFWQYPAAVRAACTITEMVFVPDAAKDGLYLLNLQTASFDLDASPSKPVLYALENI
jgi:kynurenine formamidase